VLMTLRAISINLTNAASITARMWNQSIQISNADDHAYEHPPHSTFPSAPIPSFSQLEQQSHPESHDDESNAGDSPGSNNDNSQHSVENLFVSLATRGKGIYVCPHGYDCKKWGVKSDGGLLTFERNSSFRLVTSRPAPLDKSG
jgi:hypothetical protein